MAVVRASNAGYCMGVETRRMSRNGRGSFTSIRCYRSQVFGPSQQEATGRVGNKVERDCSKKDFSCKRLPAVQLPARDAQINLHPTS